MFHPLLIYSSLLVFFACSYYYHLSFTPHSFSSYPSYPPHTPSLTQLPPLLTPTLGSGIDTLDIFWEDSFFLPFGDCLRTPGTANSTAAGGTGGGGGISGGGGALGAGMGLLKSTPSSSLLLPPSGKEGGLGGSAHGIVAAPIWPMSNPIPAG